MQQNLARLTTVLIFLFPSTTRIKHLCSVGSGGCGLPSLGFGLVLPSSEIIEINVHQISTTDGLYTTSLFAVINTCNTWPRTAVVTVFHIPYTFKRWTKNHAWATLFTVKNKVIVECYFIQIIEDLH